MKRINRRRTYNINHVKKEITKQNIALYNELEFLSVVHDDSSWKSLDDPTIINYLHTEEPTPEDILISKDLFKTFSDEAIALTKVILSCPEEFFLLSGRISQSLLGKECKKQLGWGRIKTKSAIFELGLHLQCACR